MGDIGFFIVVVSEIRLLVKNKIFFGIFIYFKILSEFEYFYNVVVVVDSFGIIVVVFLDIDIVKVKSIFFFQLNWFFDDIDMVVVKVGQFFFFGFIDIYFYVLQYFNVGFFGNLIFLDWLNIYIFFLEVFLFLFLKV